ncbi:PREDICTED: uncharacterized protein LOC109234771 [Nicotiana attenuata]|uniref:uncharacterized protein LOC109234771 n=1 Tax=Nicotiana attenuata TaxID=49451 RepID=UPI000905C4D6|nr:PREDICTED: uncharacterized protein LOC109234771 [Nicotiana attenuata]
MGTSTSKSKTRHDLTQGHYNFDDTQERAKISQGYMDQGYDMSSSANASVHGNDNLGSHGENNSIGVHVQPINPKEVPNMEPIDINSHNALNADSGTHPVWNERREARSGDQRTRGMEDGGISLQSAALKPIQKKFRMQKIPKYNGTTDPNEHISTYTCGIKGNDLEDDEIESVFLKRFGETLSKGAMFWYNNLPPNSIDSFAMLADSFVKAHASAIKVATRKYDVFEIKQRENEILMEFVSHFQSERMELPPVSDD